MTAPTAPLSVACPDCGAPPETPCYVSSGSATGSHFEGAGDTTHANRVDLAAVEQGWCKLCGGTLYQLNAKRWHPGKATACPPLPDPNVDWNGYAAKLQEGMAPGDPGAENYLADRPMCPECRNGKHRNCDGAAQYPDDSIGPCLCADTDHDPPDQDEERAMLARYKAATRQAEALGGVQHPDGTVTKLGDEAALDAQIDRLHGPGAAAALDAAIADGSIFGSD